MSLLLSLALSLFLSLALSLARSLSLSLSLSLFLSFCLSLFPTLGVGLLDFKLNSSPRPELFSSPGLLLAHPWSAQPQSVPGVPNSRVSLQCPIQRTPAQPQSLPRVPNRRVSPKSPTNPRVSLECQPQRPNPRVSLAQPQSVPGVPSSRISLEPNPRVSLECPAPECCWSAQPQSI